MPVLTLKKVGDDIRTRLKNAELNGQIPSREQGDGYGWIRYDVRVSSAKAGPKVNITINGYEWLIPDRAEAGALARWRDTDGAALIAAVDKVAARERFSAVDSSVTLGGETKFGICIVSVSEARVSRG
jgi:hypothetical protein